MARTVFATPLDNSGHNRGVKLSLEFDPAELAAARELLEGTGKRVETAMARSINYVLRRVRSESIRSIADVLAVRTLETIRGQLSVEQATTKSPSGFVRVTGRKLPIYDNYKFSPTTPSGELNTGRPRKKRLPRKGVKIQTRRNKPASAYAKTFVATYGKHLQVIRRPTHHRDRLNVVYGPSIPGPLLGANNTAREAIMSRAQQLLEVRFANQVGYLINEDAIKASRRVQRLARQG